MRLLSAFLAALFFLVACQPEQNSPSAEATTSSNDFELDVQAAAYLQHEHLQLFPVRAKSNFLEKAAKLPEFQSLAQSLESKKVEIAEQDAKGYEAPQLAQGGAVNTLVARNNSDEPVYLMAGEVVLGGRQDRVLAHDVVLPPNSDWRPIEVYCVEHGRWEYKNDAPEDFAQYAFTASNSVRYAVVHEQQQDRVWEEVGNVTTMNYAESATGSYQALQKSENYQKTSAAYLEAFQHKLQNDASIVGVIAATGDKVIACDIFGSNALFRKQYPQLLHAYIADASTFGQKVEQEEEAVKQFFAAAMQEYENRRPKNNDRVKALWNGQLLHFTWLQNNSAGKVTRNVPSYRESLHSIYTNQF